MVMDEEFLKLLVNSGNQLADTIMNAHSDGAKSAIQIMKAASTDSVKAIEAGSKKAVDAVSSTTKDTLIKAKEVTEETVDKLSSGFSNISSSFKSEMDNISKIFTSGDIANALNKTFGSVLNSIEGKVKDIGKDFNIEFEDGDLQKIVQGTGFVLLNLKSIENLKPFENLSKDGEEFANKTSGVVKNLLENVLPTMGVGGKVKDMVAFVASVESAGDGARALESSILSAAGAAGRYNDIMGRIGGLEGDGFDRFASQFFDKAADIGNATNQSAKDIMAFQQSLMQIRGGLDETVNSLAYATGETDVLTAAINVSAGAGLKTKETLDMMTQQYMNFGTAAGKSVQDVAKLGIVSQDLEVPLEKIKSGVSSVVSSLIYYKDNTEAAINITSRLGSSLKDAGMSPEAIAKLTTVVSKNVSEMQLAQRAFLSQQTGGPGGLSGGYQIELLKKQGKLDEVQKLTEEALKKQFGGNIVTLEDAAKDEGAARQLTKQVQLATTGPTKVVDTEAQAFALFEAMRTGTAKDVLSGKDSLDQAALQGQERIKRQESEINKLNNAAIVSASKASLMAAEGARIVSEKYRQTLGNMQVDFRNGGMASNILSSLTPSREQSVESAAETELYGYATSTMKRPGTANENLNEILRNTINSINGVSSQDEMMSDLGLSTTGIQRNLSGGKSGSGSQAQNNFEKTFGTIVVETVCKDCNMKHTKEIATQVASEVVSGSSRAARNATVAGTHAH